MTKEVITLKAKVNKKIAVLKKRLKRTKDIEAQRFIEGQINTLRWCKLQSS